MQEHNYPIKEWAKDDQPREKLLQGGAENLSNSELLAILIQKGTRQKSAVDLAKELLRMGKNNLNELAKLTVKEMVKIKGIGIAKTITLTAALELGMRPLQDFTSASSSSSRRSISSTETAASLAVV